MYNKQSYIRTSDDWQLGDGCWVCSVTIYTFLTESLQILRNSDIKYEIYYNHKSVHIPPHTTITDERYSLYRLHKTSKFLIANFWIMSSCSQVVDYHRYRAADYLHSQSRSENDGTYTFKTLWITYHIRWYNNCNSQPNLHHQTTFKFIIYLLQKFLGTPTLNPVMLHS